MPATVEITIGNTFPELNSAVARIEDFLSESGAPAKTAYIASLAIEEFVSNTIKYAFNDTHVHQITIRANLTPPTLTLTFIDDGHHFDPLAAPDPGLDLSLEDRAIGGVGIHLVRQMAKNLSYLRTDNQNIVQVEIEA